MTQFAFEFVKSSYSTSAGECVEVALNVPGVVAVRDSKDATGPVLRVSPAAWGALISSARRSL